MNIQSAALKLLLVLMASAGSQASAIARDLVVYDANILTVDSTFSRARAAVIRDGRFLFVGSDKQAIEIASADAVRVDMNGRTILPGFNDSHQHQTGHGKYWYRNLRFANARTIADMMSLISERATHSKAAEWIIGERDWGAYDLVEKRLPTRAELDAAAPVNPVALPGPHLLVANRVALELAGISQATADPVGGTIVRDDKGQPTGLLLGNAAGLVLRLLPEPADDERLAGMRNAIKHNSSNGITSVGDAQIDPADVAVFRRLYAKGEMNVRVDAIYAVDPNLPEAELRKKLASLGPPGALIAGGMLQATSLGETSIDGADRGAVLTFDMPGKPGVRNPPRVSLDQLTRFAITANEFGWRLRPHATGDGAITEVLNAYEAADKVRSIAGRRWMIDHAFLLNDTHYDRVNKLGLIINSQYSHNAVLGPLLIEGWGAAAADRVQRYRDWLAHGIHLAGGSDGYVAYPGEPLLLIYGMVTRETQWGGKLGKDEGLTREQAIRALTIWPAFTTFEENVKGSIEAGKFADFVVISDDIMSVPDSALKGLKVLATVVGGRTVFGNLAEAVDPLHARR